MSNQKSELYKIGREVLSLFTDKPEEFVVEEVKLALRSALEANAELMLDMAVDDIYRRAEASAKSAAESGEQRELFDTGGMLILEGSRRIAKKHAMKAHFVEHLKFVDVNFERVRGAWEREHKEFDLLSPYWADGMTYRQARDAYIEANPADDAGAA